MTTNPPPRPGGVRVRGLHKSYGSVRAVQDVDLDIAPGETVALLGPNGAGKSTTIDVLLGLGRPDRGQVEIFGMRPEEATKAGVVAAMLQSGALIRDLSVRELVTLQAALYPRPLAVEEVLALTGTSSVADRRTQKLSGGQMQRVRFALALVADADLLVLDEPTVAMDVEGRHDFWSTMRAVAASGKTILFATHYLEEADAYADRIVLMARGRVVADGPASEIKARVGRRVIRATLPDAGLDELRALPGVDDAERRGTTVQLTCSDSDAAVRALLATHPSLCDLEIQGAGLEEAFLRLTGDPEENSGADAGPQDPPQPTRRRADARRRRPAHPELTEDRR